MPRRRAPRRRARLVVGIVVLVAAATGAACTTDDAPTTSGAAPGSGTATTEATPGTAVDPEEACLRAAEAVICASPVGDQVEIEADGLEPGSTVTFTSSRTGPVTLEVGDEGRLSTVVAMTTTAPTGWGADVSAVAAGGTSLVGRLTSTAS